MDLVGAGDRVKVTTEPAGLLDIAPFTVADARGALLIAARHAATIDLLRALMAVTVSCPVPVWTDLFVKLRSAVAQLADVEAGLTSPADVISVPWSPRELADGTALAAAVARCEQDIHELLVELVPDKPTKPTKPPTAAPAASALPDADSPLWSYT